MASGCGFILIGLATLAPPGPADVFAVLLGLALVALGAWFVWSASRARLLLTPAQLVERGDLRSKVIPTGQIREFYVDRTPHVVPWFSMWVRLGSGEERALQQCRVLEFRPSVAHRRLLDAADCLNAWLAER
jgi:hypothetical protein